MDATMETVRVVGKRDELTARLAATLPGPPQGSRQVEYTDSRTPGLRLSIGAGGKRSWIFRYSLPGRRYRAVKIGTFPATGLDDARRRSLEMRRAVEAGRDPAQEKEEERRAPTLAEFARDSYMPFAETRKITHRADRNKLENQILPALGRLPLTAVATTDVQRYVSDVKRRGSNATANRHLSLLSRMFNLAVKWGLLSANPARGVEKLPETGRERYLSQDEAKRLLAALDSSNNPMVACALRLLLYTGMRRGEALGLRWDDVNLTEAYLIIPHTKNGRPRRVPLNPLALGELELATTWRGEGNPHVFPGRGATGHVAEPKKVFAAALKAAGVRNLRMHDLRHSFASFAVNSGASLYEVQRLLGHQSSKMTERYSHIADAALRRASDGVAGAVSAAVAAGEGEAKPAA